MSASGIADDGPDVLGLRVPLEHDLEAEDVPIERERALEVGDLDAHVMGPADGGHALLRWLA